MAANYLGLLIDILVAMMAASEKRWTPLRRERFAFRRTDLLRRLTLKVVVSLVTLQYHSLPRGLAVEVLLAQAVEAWIRSCLGFLMKFVEPANFLKRRV